MTIAKVASASLPPPTTTAVEEYPRSRGSRFRFHPIPFLFAAALLSLGLSSKGGFWSSRQSRLQPFYSNVTSNVGLCTGEHGAGVSHAGYIGLKGDSLQTPKRSFFWFFEAQNGAKDAPIILTHGGGPGASGMLNTFLGQSHCRITLNGTMEPNPNAWTEKLHLLALDHPIGTGFSYGIIPNNSRTAGEDIYDFLQKFYTLFPDYAENQLVLTSGSHGGVYVPNTATVIHEQNLLVAAGRGQRGARRINLESMMVTNPISDFLSQYRWLLQYRCYNTHIYNSTTCSELYAYLPSCLESIQFAYENPSNENRIKAEEICEALDLGDTNGTAVTNVKVKCDGSIEDCMPEWTPLQNFLNSSSTKSKLGIPQDFPFSLRSMPVNEKFESTGDVVQQAYLLYEPLVAAGIRLLHFVGALDANCGWPGIYSFLKLLRTPFKDEFLNAPDIPWPDKESAVVRAIGAGAGNFTWILVSEAGHFVIKDQPTLSKQIIELWVENKPYISL